MRNIFDEFLKRVYSRYESAKWIFLLLCLFFGGLIACSLYMTESEFQFISIRDELQKNAELEFQHKIRSLEYATQTVADTVLAVQSSLIFNRYLADRDDAQAKSSVSSLLMDLLRDKKIVSQLRYINIQGDEIIRVERDSEGSEPYFVAEQRLQNKKHRYYFDEIQRASGQVWFSRLDLNVEHGAIVYPVVPTIRVGVAVKSPDGKNEGIVIANIFMEHILKEITESYFYHVSLIDSDGMFLIHQRFENGKIVDYNWSRYLKNGQTLQKYLPDDADEILSNDVFYTDYLFSKKISHILSNGDALIMLFQARQEKIDDYYKKRDSFLLTALAIIFFFSLPIAYLFARVPFIFKKPVTQVEGLLQQQITTIDEFVMLTITDKKGVIIDVTKAFCRLSGYEKDELIGHTHGVLRHPETPDALYQDLWNTVTSGKCWNGEIKDRRQDGSEFWVDVTIRPIHDEKNKFIGYAAYRRDITHQKLVEQQSITDALSKLYNRRHFDKVFGNEINRARRESAQLCFLMLDIDHFKRYNDTYGHPKGDEVILKIGKLIRKHTKRAEDSGFRLGGEEFGIIFRSEDAAKAHAYAEKIRESVMALQIRHEKNDGFEVLTVSIGLSVVQDFGHTDAKKIYEMTDQALYRAKNLGRNRVEVAS